MDLLILFASTRENKNISKDLYQTRNAKNKYELLLQEYETMKTSNQVQNGIILEYNKTSFCITKIRRISTRTNLKKHNNQKNKNKKKNLLLNEYSKRKTI